MIVACTSRREEFTLSKMSEMTSLSASPELMPSSSSCSISLSNFSGVILLSTLQCEQKGRQRASSFACFRHG